MLKITILAFFILTASVWGVFCAKSQNMDPLQEKQTDSQPWQGTSEKAAEAWDVMCLEGAIWRVISTHSKKEEAEERLKELRHQGWHKGVGIVGPADTVDPL